MKKKKALLTVTGVIAVVTAIIYLAVVLLFETDTLPYDQTEALLLVPGYLLLPLPLVGFFASVLLQIFSVISTKKRSGKNN
jgi:hypothetical protein